MIVDVPPAYLLNILDAQTAKKVWRELSGCRLYFPKCKCEHDEIRTIYHQMGDIKRVEKIKRLSDMFEKSEEQIRRVTSIQKGLFNEL